MGAEADPASYVPDGVGDQQRALPCAALRRQIFARHVSFLPPTSTVPQGVCHLSWRKHSPFLVRPRQARTYHVH